MAETGLPTEGCVPYQEEMGPLPTGAIPCGAVQKCLPGGTSSDFVLHAAKGGAYPVGDFTGDAEGQTGGSARRCAIHRPIKRSY